MKKIIYNVFTKLVLFIAAIAITGGLAYQGYGMLQRHDDFCSDWQEARDRSTLYDIHPTERLRNDVMDAMYDVLYYYQLSNMDGVDSLLQLYSDDMWFYVIIANATEIYTNLPECDTSGEDKLGIVNNFDVFDYEATGASSDYCLWLDPETNNLYKHDRNGGIIYDEAIQQISSEINEALSVRVFLTWEYQEEVYEDVEEAYSARFNNIMAEYKADMQENVIRIIGTALALVVVLLLLACVCGRTADGLKELHTWEKACTELHILVICALCIPFVIAAIYICENIDMQSKTNDWLSKIDNYGIKTLCMAAAVILLTMLYIEFGILIKKIKNRSFWKDWLVVKTFIRIKSKVAAFIKKNYDASAYAALPETKKAFVRRVISDIAVAVIMLILLIVMSLLYGEIVANYDRIIGKLNEWGYDWLVYNTSMPSTIAPIYIIVCIPIIIYYINSFHEYKKLREMNRIVAAVDTIYEGDYAGVELAEGETSETLKKLANLSNSFEESVRKQVEAEKLQIELVANVSHDLKTPLTSIISYVDLLKEEEMSDVAKDYVRVLVDKSARLKDIVADVFDLAKATSGEQVEMEQLDGVVLINQVLSDMSDRIEETGRDLRSKMQVETAAIRGNGQKLYRVFQNVIDNALKYSMPGTRIYLNAESINGEFVVTVKNVSEYEIDYTAEEIMSRFTRGDKARHSEGNGLGLSIAKSFTELCGGSFEVKLDDDVFMVVIRLR